MQKEFGQTAQLGLLGWVVVWARFIPLTVGIFEAQIGKHFLLFLFALFSSEDPALKRARLALKRVKPAAKLPNLHFPRVQLHYTHSPLLQN